MAIIPIRFSTAWADARDRGWLTSLGIIACRIVPERVVRFRRFRIYQLRPIGNQTPPPRLDALNLVVERCQESEQLHRLAELTRTRVPVNAENVCGWLMKIDGQEVGGLWTADHSFIEESLGIRIRLNSHQRWLFSAYIVKPHRRKGVYGMLLDEVLRQQPEGIDVYAAITNCNQVSLAAHRKFTAVATHSAIALRLLGRTFLRSRDLCPGSESPSLELS